MLESEIKKKGTARLQSWGWIVLHLIQTNLNGIQDSIIFRAGIIWFIEWKRPGHNPRPLQSYRIDKLRQQGFQTLVITDIRQLDFLK
jgi:hypothetical protein